MNVDSVLLKTVAFLYCSVRRLYISGKISYEDWCDLNDEIKEFLLKEIEDGNIR